MPPKGCKHSAAAKAKMSAARSVPQVECVCDNCGTKVMRDRSEVKRRKNIFCNKNCESEFRRGVPRPKDVCDKISASQKGKTLSEEHITNIKIGAKKRFEDPEERERVRISANNRQPVAKATKRKMRDTRHRILAEDPDLKVRALEGMIGGFWYGNVRYWYVDVVKYCELFTTSFKERVRAYRGYVCFECGTPQWANFTKKGKLKALTVHHVHYDKKMCCNGSPRDCIPLCMECNSMVNFNRDMWEEYFTVLIYAYDSSGKCFLTKEEMKRFTEDD